MSYIPLVLNFNTPETVKNFVQQHLEQWFKDAHYLLLFPPPYDSYTVGNFATANHLLALVSGLSSWLTDTIDTQGQSAEIFKKVLIDYYPWDVQPPQGPEGSNSERAVGHIYEYFRNPLVHTLGTRTAGNFSIVIFKNPKTESMLEELEKSENSPGPAIRYNPIIINGEKIEEISLDINNFYWGIRIMIKRMTNDKDQIEKTNRGLKVLGIR